jgi:hypothetical protein
MITVASHAMKGSQAHSWGHMRKGGNTGMTEQVCHCFPDVYLTRTTVTSVHAV